MDLIGPLPITPSGHPYILVKIDYFTKWANGRPLRKIDASKIAQEFMAGWVADHGAPCCIHTDRGKQFERQLLRELCQLLGNHKSRTTAYHPEGNGQVELKNRTLKVLLQIQLNRTDHDQWGLAIPMCLMADRSAVHASTSQTPAMMTFRHELRLPADVVTGLPNQLGTMTEPVYVSQVRSLLAQAH